MTYMQLETADTVTTRLSQHSHADMHTYTHTHTPTHIHIYIHTHTHPPQVPGSGDPPGSDEGAPQPHPRQRTGQPSCRGAGGRDSGSPGGHIPPPIQCISGEPIRYHCAGEVI